MQIRAALILFVCSHQKKRKSGGGCGAVAGKGVAASQTADRIAASQSQGDTLQRLDSWILIWPTRETTTNIIHEDSLSARKGLTSGRRL